MGAKFTAERVRLSLLDGALIGVMIVVLDTFLSHRSLRVSILYGVVFGAVAFLLRVISRPDRPAALPGAPK
jgi:hypothetical protein